jgi:hypothetical protein
MFLIQKLQADSVQPLLTAHGPISDSPEPVVHMATSSAMDASPASLSRIGRWLGEVHLKRLGQIPSKSLSDGWKGSVRASVPVCPHAKPLLGVFHHQHRVTRWVKEQVSEADQTAAKHDCHRPLRPGVCEGV